MCLLNMVLWYQWINPYPASIFCPENGVCFLSIQMHFRLDFIMVANISNPDQTAPNGAVWSGSILFAIYATKEQKQIRGADNIIVTGSKKC